MTETPLTDALCAQVLAASNDKDYYDAVEKLMAGARQLERALAAEQEPVSKVPRYLARRGMRPDGSLPPSDDDEPSQPEPVSDDVRDARRYRRIRECDDFCVTQNIGHDWITLRDGDLDAAADAALASQGDKHG